MADLSKVSVDLFKNLPGTSNLEPGTKLSRSYLIENQPHNAEFELTEQKLWKLIKTYPISSN